MSHNVIQQVMKHHGQAAHVLYLLKECANKYDLVSVADYYAFVGAFSTLKDHAYGWVGDSITEAEVVRDGHGYIIKLPPVVDLLGGKEVPVAKEQLAVRLDVMRLPNGDDAKHSIIIAESLLNICGLTKIWDLPEHGHRIFYVRSLPQDVPQAGIYWFEETLPSFNKNPFKGGETES